MEPWDRRAWKMLGDFIRDELARKGWTQQQLADEAGVTQVTISAIVNGRARGRIPRSMPAIEQALGWPVGSTRILLDGGVLAWSEFLKQIRPDEYAPTVRGTNQVRASSIAALVRHIQGARIAVDQLPLTERDRERFLAELDDYENRLTTTLDREDSESEAG